MSATQPTVNDVTVAELSVQWVGRGELPQEVLRGLHERGVHVLRSPTADCPPARIAFAEPAPAGATTTPLQGRRILVLHSNPEQASLLTWALSARGADARAYPDATTLLADAGSSDADAVLVDERDLLADSWEHVCTLWRHLRLRWTPCVVAPAQLLEHGDAADLDGLCVTLHALAADRDRCVEARDAHGAQLPLAGLGPARTLLALLDSVSPFWVEFVTARLTVEVDLADGLILGARGRFSDGASVELLGARALAALLEEIDGTVRLHAARQEPLSNLMASLENALSHHALERATTTEESVLLLLTNPSTSGVRPVSTASGEEDLEDATRKLSEHSVMALMREQQAFEAAAAETAAAETATAETAPALPQPVPPAVAPRSKRGTGLARIIGVARVLLTLAALCLAALCTLTLWQEYRSAPPVAARKAVPSVPAAPRADVPELAPAPAPLPVAAAPAEPTRDPAVARLVRRANDLRRRQHLSRARTLYERALALAPAEPSALAGLARTAIEQNDLPTALASAQKLVALEPTEDDYRVLLARIEKRSEGSED